MKNRLKKIIPLFFVFTLMFTMAMPPRMDVKASAAGQTEIVFADAGWDSARFHTALAGLIAERVFGYTWREVSGGTTILHEGLINGEVDVHMEVWTDNIASYRRDIQEDRLKEVGLNFDDNNQGFYVPRYVIEGDLERGIEPMAPDLRTVKDLLNYREIFPDDENRSRGRIYGSIPGWEVDTIMFNKFMAYGFDEEWIYFRPGSDAALAASIANAYEAGEPIVAYYWEPTWLTGLYDLVLLEDAPYNEATYEDGIGALPSVRVAIGTSNDFYDNNPEYVDFLSRYETSSALTSEALAYIQETGASYEEAAIWFIHQHEDMVSGWLGEENMALLMTSIDEPQDDTVNWLREFPFRVPLDLAALDASVRGFSQRYDGFFGAIRNGLTFTVTTIERTLNFIPWFVILLLVFLAGWRTSKRPLTGLFYAGLLFLVGLAGLWTLMNETLAIVITSVLISLILGFPIGVLISASEKAHAVVRPILDTMQTMPVFVYLIPALLFFGLGKAPAVIATTIYAIVPMIRLTSHGIKHIDQEVVEASRSFGSTYMQSLVKVQIPQALPTILAGVNQTIMMAMAMVVTTSMIGATGLGMEVLNSVNRIEIGRGLVSGTAVVIIAVLLDRLSQAWFKEKEGEIDG